LKEELTPLADEIDRTNDFPQMRQFWKKLGDMGLLGITVPGIVLYVSLFLNVL